MFTMLVNIKFTVSILIAWQIIMFINYYVYLKNGTIIDASIDKFDQFNSG